MFFRFSFNRLFLTTAAFTILAAGVPAYGANQKPEVEVDLSVLQNLPVRPLQPVHLTNPALIDNPAPVEVTPLQPGDVSHVTPEQPPVISEPAPPPKPKPLPKAKPKAVHKAAVLKKKKSPAPRPHPVRPPASKPQVAAAKTTIAPAIKPAPTSTLLSIDAPTQNPAAPDGKKPAINIEDISAAQNAPPPAPVSPAPPQPVAIKTFTPAPLPAVPVTPVVKAPEKIIPAPPQTPPASAPAQPPAEKQNVPRPPPADSRETSHFSIPFKAGAADQLDSQMTAILQSQILPLLKNHPAWRLQINAFASPLDNEPISARRVSLARALAVRSWLLDKGVAARRMDVRAAGVETGHEAADRVDMVFVDPDGG